MDEDKKELILRDLYYSPKTGYRSAKHLLELAQEEDPSFTLEDVEDWLKKQEVYTKYKSFSSPHHYRTTFVRYLGEQIQLDLAYLNKQKDEGFYILLIGIEILSRFAFVRVIKDKTGKTVVEGLKEIFADYKDRFHQYPKLIQFDEGSEFVNKIVKDYISSLDAVSSVTVSKRKASIVERLIRTLKEKIRKHHSYTGTWYRVLPQIVENYNTQEHSSIKMKPADVNQSNQHKAWIHLFGKIAPHIKDPKFKVGDKVRILNFDPAQQSKEYQKYFKKKYPERLNKERRLKERKLQSVRNFAPPFSDEVFLVDKVQMGDPITYRLYSPETEIEILGSYYENELSTKIENHFSKKYFF